MDDPYKDNRSYHIGYKKAKNPDAYFRRYESQIILYGGARRMLEQAGINLKGLNVDKLKAEYQELMKQKSELTQRLKQADSYEAAKAAFLEKEELEKHLITQSTLAEIRHSIDTRDGFYDTEMKFWNAAMPELQEYTHGLTKRSM